MARLLSRPEQSCGTLAQWFRAEAADTYIVYFVELYVRVNSSKFAMHYEFKAGIELEIFSTDTTTTTQEMPYECEQRVRLKREHSQRSTATETLPTYGALIRGTRQQHRAAAKPRPLALAIELPNLVILCQGSRRLSPCQRMEKVLALSAAAPVSTCRWSRRQEGQQALGEWSGTILVR
ncbi:hypothetical protein TARUN_5899 [Trichoderma arundinaceum]|uniref:Uncharacterized protein n=1 Tax=Trichoderma arundinaceum TaxID=490622 RepID=A0A395NJT0_TRIAR|nr:hypothetical protein TARUN_5899 [Trichoderma arundinaceum]